MRQPRSGSFLTLEGRMPYIVRHWRLVDPSLRRPVYGLLAGGAALAFLAVCIACLACGAEFWAAVAALAFGITKITAVVMLADLSFNLAIDRAFFASSKPLPEQERPDTPEAAETRRKVVTALRAIIAGIMGLALTVIAFHWDFIL